jgi:hypothetical protein
MGDQTCNGAFISSIHEAYFIFVDMLFYLGIYCYVYVHAAPILLKRKTSILVAVHIFNVNKIEFL